MIPSPTPEIINSATPENETALCKDYAGEAIYIDLKEINSFVEQINQLGKCGYRLEKAAKVFLEPEDTVVKLRVFGLARRDAGNKYEYNWFAAVTPGQLQTIAVKQAEQGFYYSQKMMFISGRCSQNAERRKEDNDNLGGLGNILDLKLGSSGSVFIFERRNGETRKIEYRVIDGRVTGEKGEQEINQKNLDNYIAKGFRPVDYYYLGSFNTYTLLMEKDETIKPQGEYRLDNTFYRMENKLTQLSEEGFRPVLFGLGFAVVNRTSKEPLNVIYRTNERFKELQKHLPEWSKYGYAYQATGISSFNFDCDPFEGNWLFAVSKSQTSDKPDYKFINASEIAAEYVRKNNLTGQKSYTPQQLQELNDQINAAVNTLIKQGYTLRNLGFMDSPIFLFELPKTH